jgi:hypothetical protein
MYGFGPEIVKNSALSEKFDLSHIVGIQFFHKPINTNTWMMSAREIPANFFHVKQKQQQQRSHLGSPCRATERSWEEAAWRRWKRLCWNSGDSGDHGYVKDVISRSPTLGPENLRRR